MMGWESFKRGVHYQNCIFHFLNKRSQINYHIFSNPMESRCKKFAVVTSDFCTDISGTRRGILFIHVKDVWTSRVTFITDDCACDGTRDGSGGGGGGGSGEDTSGPSTSPLNM